MDKSVGTIIYEQLGGNRFILMTGARNFGGHASEAGNRGALTL